MRMINMACDPNYTFSIDGHTMTIIEADGVNVDPLGVDSIQIFAGERPSYSWLFASLRADNYTRSTLLLRSRGQPDRRQLLLVSSSGLVIKVER